MNLEDIVAILDWRTGRESSGNREMVSCARAHGSLVEDGAGAAKSLVVTRDRVYLARASPRALRFRLESNIVSPPDGDMVR